MTDIPVKPTGPSQTDNYSDIAVANLFNAHVNSLNVEKQVIWQRYHAMLLANSFFFTFATTHIGQPSQVLVICVFGLVLCFVWYKFNAYGWELLWRHVESTAQFKWTDNINPYDLPYHQAVRSGTGIDHIRKYAQFVVVIFAAAYIVVSTWAIYHQFCLCVVQ